MTEPFSKRRQKLGEKQYAIGGHGDINNSILDVFNFEIFVRNKWRCQVGSRYLILNLKEDVWTKKTNMVINNIQKVLNSEKNEISSGKSLGKEVNPRFDRWEHQHSKRKKQKITTLSFCFHLIKLNDPSRLAPLWSLQSQRQK